MLEGAIFHSDRGSQYTSAGQNKVLNDQKMIQSMSKPIFPYDNSCIESFFACLKKECIYRRDYRYIKELETDLFE